MISRTGSGFTLLLLLALCTGCDSWLIAEGTVTDAQGKPIAGARVSLQRASDTKDDRLATVQETDRNGKFTINSQMFAPFTTPHFTLRIEKKGLRTYESDLTDDAPELEIILKPVPDAERN